MILRFVFTIRVYIVKNVFFTTILASFLFITRDSPFSINQHQCWPLILPSISFPTGKGHKQWWQHLVIEEREIWKRKEKAKAFLAPISLIKCWFASRWRGNKKGIEEFPIHQVAALSSDGGPWVQVSSLYSSIISRPQQLPLI